MNSKPSKDEIAGYFNQHCVPIYIHINKGEDSHDYVISSFVISIDDEWFLITAGHCLNKIEKIKEAGYKITKARFLDCGGLTAKHFLPIPFDYDSSVIAHLGDDKYDYGIIHITKYYRNLMECNEIIALNEETWEKQPTNPDFYFLLGIPGQLTNVTEDKIQITTTLHTVTKCESVPDSFEKTDAPTFYGHIHLDDNLTSIVGMSGGPLFSFKRTDSSELKYWLCAVQSRWIPSEKLIAACLMNPFASLVKDIMRDVWRPNAEI